MGRPIRFAASVRSTAFTYDARTRWWRLFVGLANGDMFYSTDPELQKSLRSQSMVSSAIEGMFWLPATAQLLVVQAAGEAVLLDIRESRPTHRVGIQSTMASARWRFTQIDERRFVLFASTPEIQLVTSAQDVSSRRLEVAGQAAIRCCAAQPDGRLVFGSADGTVLAFELLDTEARDLGSIARFTRGVGALAIVGDSGADPRVVCGIDDGRVVVLDPMSGKIHGEFDGHTKAINGLLALDSRRVASWSLDGSLRVWDVRDMRAIGAAYSRAPFICARLGRSGRIYALDAFGQAWMLEVSRGEVRTA